MQRVLVVDKHKNPLMPCHPARARQLLSSAKAAVLRQQPFTIILLERDGGKTQEIQVKIDPGSKTTGIAIVADFRILHLLEKWEHHCAYCGVTDMPLEVEHIVPKARGGSQRVSNLTIACEDCNREKGNQTAAEFGYPEIGARAKQPLKDAAAVNATRWELYKQLKATGLPLEIGTGARTKYNRIRQGYPKTHWLDAVCVGDSGEQVFVPATMRPLIITATGRQSRQMCRVDKYGFPRTRAKQQRTVKGFQTGDMVRAVVTSGKKAGTYTGRVAVRASGFFDIKTVNDTAQGISYRDCRIMHHCDGYAYHI
ncbi:MAG: HNH endonuclease [Chloroflexi bacterium]|nr:HNH endonuclease [Chloroflexota bacterium]